MACFEIGARILLLNLVHNFIIMHHGIIHLHFRSFSKIGKLTSFLFFEMANLPICYMVVDDQLVWLLLMLIFFTRLRMLTFLGC